MANERCEMSADAKAALDEWLGGKENYELLHMWQCNETLKYYVCIKQSDLLSFLRVFLLGEKWVLSQDKCYEIK